MDAELEKKLYLDGIALFNEHEFFEAHEVWEDIWHEAYGTKFEFYQGMIQCAVALEHYLRSNPRGVVSLYDSYRRHFKDVPDVFMGLNVKEFLTRMRQTLAPSSTPPRHKSAAPSRSICRQPRASPSITTPSKPA